MELIRGNQELEKLNKSLCNPKELAEYKSKFDGYIPALIPRLLGRFLVWSGDMLYGSEPSYLKFRAVEVIARVPYHSWSSALYTLLTICYADESRALELSKRTRFARLAQDNETMHVVVISQLLKQELGVRAGYLRHTLIPMVFAFFYFWTSYVLYLIKPQYSYELNYLFESHAFEQYSRFIEQHQQTLTEKMVSSQFLEWYGRHPANQYEFFQSIRNDELIHRNKSIEAMG